ncbi:MAG: FHA domain-containing protein, partial [Bacteriovoracaceae bacterium]|nr:FHA domain-containing protein [Bacteriovoracaceae bacterium]
MSFYISIEGKTLKIGKYVIIGRGSPFDNLLPFKDIGRAHAKVLEQGRNYYIKDLGTETGTFVNGKKI